jgi:cellobiose-specific phosphotransferase system component IIC
MEILPIIAIVALNFCISFWNAYASAKVWAESKAAGGWSRLMAWVGAIMSAIGFTWCYLSVVVFIAYNTELLGEYHALLALKIGYVVLMPGLLVGGFMITVQSWANAFRSGRVVDYGISAYNTYAQHHNTMSAIHNYGEAFGSLLDAFSSKGSSSSSSSDDNKGAGLVLLIILVIFCLAAGIITTVLIIKKFSATAPLYSWDELEERNRTKATSRRLAT